MGLINFWIIYDNDSKLAQVEGLLPPLPTLDSEGVAPPTNMGPTNSVQARVFKEVGLFKLRSLYRRIDDLSDIVALREGLQAMEDIFAPAFYVVGMWHFETGEPVGGVGSPWFRTPTWVEDHLPRGVIEDPVLMAGQAARKFI